jgi:hypothetical protein
MRKVAVELVLLAIAVSLTLEVVKGVIPYLPVIWLLVFAHYTWEAVSSGSRLSAARKLKKRLSGGRLMISYVVIGCAGAGVACGYWWGLNTFFAPKIAAYEAEQRQKRETKPQQDVVRQTRQELYIKLSRQKAERSQLYNTEWFTNLKFITADAEAGNKHLSGPVRQKGAEEGRKILAELEAMQQGPIAKHERDFAETIAQIRLAFPHNLDLDRLLSNVSQRPVWDIHDPDCDTRDHARMQQWADAESKKVEDVTKQSKERLDALLVYIQGHLAD